MRSFSLIPRERETKRRGASYIFFFFFDPFPVFLGSAECVRVCVSAPDDDFPDDACDSLSGASLCRCSMSADALQNP